MRRVLNALALLLLIAGPSAAQFGKGTVVTHTHSSTRDGGSTVQPVTLRVTGTATINTLRVPGYYVLVSSVDIHANGGTSWTFSGLSSSVTYRLEYNVTASAAGTGGLQLTFNGDSTCGHYRIGAAVVDSKNTPGTVDNLSSNVACWISISSAAVPAKGLIMGEAIIQTGISSATAVQVHGVYTQDHSSGFSWGGFGGSYNQGAQLTSITIDGATAGNPAYGELLLYKRIEPAGYSLPGSTGLGTNMTVHQHSSADSGGTYLAPSSMTVTGGNGLSVTYGVTAGSVTTPSIKGNGAGVTVSTNIVTTSSATFGGNVRINGTATGFALDVAAGNTNGSLLRNETGYAQFGSYAANNGIAVHGENFGLNAADGGYFMDLMTQGTPRVRIETDGGMRSYSRTVAQLLAITPVEAGEQFYCSNCSPAKIVVSTGTGAGNFADAAGGAFK